MKTSTPARKYLQSPRRLSALRLGLAFLGASTLAPLCEPLRAQAQEETDPVSSSQLTKVALPKGAARMRQVPEEMRAPLAKLAASSGMRLGATEVLAWQGGGYSKAKAPALLASLRASLGKAKWQFESNDTGQGFQVLTLLQPGQRGMLGVWIAADEAAILAWSEVFKADAPTAPEADTPPAEAPFETPAPRPRPATPSAPSASPGGAITRDVDAGTKVLNVMGRAQSKAPSFPAVAPRKGFARGYVKDAAGKPLAGVAIGVRSSAVGGAYSGAQGKTDAKGYYEIAVPFGAAHFYNAGYAVEYGDGQVALGLGPADGELDAFASNVGGVENFVLRGYGVANVAGAQDQPQFVGNYYGGAVTFSWHVEDDRPIFDTGKLLPPNSQVELTLTPQGALLDGSRGQSIVIRKGIGTFFGQLYVTNIPSGTYKLSARLAGGGALKMREVGPYAGRPFGLSPKEATGAATLQMRPGSADASMVAAGHGGWDSVSVELSR